MLFSLIYVSFFALMQLHAQDNEKRTLTMSPFQGLKIYSNLEVRLIASDVNKAIAYGENSDFVVLSLKEDVLKISISGGSLLTPGNTKIDLYHSKPLNEIGIYQGSNLTSFVPIEQTSLTIEAKTGAVIDLEVYCKRVDSKASLGGRIHLKGSVSNHEIHIASSGVCEAEQLITKQTKASSKGGAYAYIHANDLIDAELYGGTFRVFGNPNKQITQELLGGKVILEK